jgi:hypothetical protein
MFQLNSWGYYEIDINNMSKDKKKLLSLKLKIHEIEFSCYFKKNDDWVSKISGMTFNIKNNSYYKELKKYLDNEFIKFKRKQKLIKILKHD